MSWLQRRTHSSLGRYASAFGLVTHTPGQQDKATLYTWRTTGWHGSHDDDDTYIRSGGSLPRRRECILVWLHSSHYTAGSS